MRSDVPAAPPPVIERPTAREAPDGPYELSQNGTKYRPSMRTAEGPRGGGADWANARAWFRLPDVGDWMLRMRKEPDIFTWLLSDIYRETQAERRRLEGQAKIGRRPRVIEGSLDELWKMVTPQYSPDPFGISMRALAPGQAAKDIAANCTLSEDTVARMLDGQDITMWRLEVLARAYNVSPAYFNEWRRSWVLTVVEELLTCQPNLSIRYAKGLANLTGHAKMPRLPTRMAG